MKYHKISSNSACSDIFFPFFLSFVWVKILWGFMKFFSKVFLKISAFYLEKQKSFIPKKIFFRPLSISKQKSFVDWLNFPGRFWLRQYRKNVCLTTMWKAENVVNQTLPKLESVVSRVRDSEPSTIVDLTKNLLFLLHFYGFIVIPWYLSKWRTVKKWTNIMVAVFRRYYFASQGLKLW